MGLKPGTETSAKGNKLNGKITLVTGGGSGIGHAVALAFAREGAKVVVAGRRHELLSETERQIGQSGGDAVTVVSDICVEDAVKHMVEVVVERFGRLDCAFNNAGVLGQMGRLADLTETDFDETIGTNLKGTWLCMKYEIQQMLRQGGGCIVNNSSLSGVLATPGGSLYNASKHGILGLTKCAAVEYIKDGIRVNAVCPGSFPTAMLNSFIAYGTYDSTSAKEREEAFRTGIPAGRFGNLEEIANAVVWLCSDESSFVVGQGLVVDGGVTLM